MRSAPDGVQNTGGPNLIMYRGANSNGRTHFETRLPRCPHMLQEVVMVWWVHGEIFKTERPEASD